MDNKLMLFRELESKEFDFDSSIKEKGYATLSGIPVKVDRIIRDITRTTVIAISGTFVIRGVKIRGIWDMFGNIVEAKKILRLLSLNQFKACLDEIFEGNPKELFNLVHIQELEKNDEKE